LWQPPHAVGGPSVDYRIVIPTRGRYRPASAISSERNLSLESTPFILVKTLALLKRHGIPPSRVSLWTADHTEKALYEAALRKDPYWAASDIAVLVGCPGIMAQRNHIVKSLPEGVYIVSLDDDLSDILWKREAGNTAGLVPMPDGGFELLIYHAFSLMKRYKAHIWGLNNSQNVMSMATDGVSTRNGEINGFLYGFINRHEPRLQPAVGDATEDAERSLRYFDLDKIVLRYRMYCGQTRCFKSRGGLQDLFDGNDLKEKNASRKVSERSNAAILQRMFPSLLHPSKEKLMTSTLEVRFRSTGGMVLPTTTVLALQAANAAESAWQKARLESGPRPSRRRSASSAVSTASVVEDRTQDGKEQEQTTGVWPSGSISRPAQGVSASDASEKRNSESEWESENDVEEQRRNEDALDSAADENAQFDAVIADPAHRAAAGNSENDEEIVRRVTAEWIAEQLREVNGDFEDPVEEALRMSRQEEELKKAQVELEANAVLLAERLSRSMSGIISSPGSPESLIVSSSDDEEPPLPKRPRCSENPGSAVRAGGSGDGGRDALEELIAMGFGRTDSLQALRDTGGNTELAVAMLLSVLSCPTEEEEEEGC